MILVSACMLGRKCRYNATHAFSDEIAEFRALWPDQMLIPACPEQLGGLETPRPPCEIVGGDGFDVIDGKAKVIDCNGIDQSGAFLKGAQRTLELCRENGVAAAFLQRRSPSCGCRNIYDGTFSGTLREGAGVTAALLHRSGIEVIDNGFASYII